MSDDRCTDIKIGELLHAYELGVLGESERLQFEIHLLSCGYCFERLQTLADNIGILRDDTIVRETVAKYARESQQHKRGLTGIWRTVWEGREMVVRPIYALAVVVLLAGLVFIAIKSPSEEKVSSLQSVWLSPDRGSTSDAFVSGTNLDGVLSFVLEDAIRGRTYQLIVKNSEGENLIDIPSFDNFDSYGTCHLLFPARQMIPGSYTVLAIPKSSGAPTDTIVYQFGVVKGGR